MLCRAAVVGQPPARSPSSARLPQAHPRQSRVAHLIGSSALSQNHLVRTCQPFSFPYDYIASCAPTACAQRQRATHSRAQNTACRCLTVAVPPHGRFPVLKYWRCTGWAFGWMRERPSCKWWRVTSSPRASDPDSYSTLVLDVLCLQCVCVGILLNALIDRQTR